MSRDAEAWSNLSEAAGRTARHRDIEYTCWFVQQRERRPRGGVVETSMGIADGMGAYVAGGLLDFALGHEAWLVLGVDGAHADATDTPH
eukprot:6212097-Pleurochrysis_carterae.AAC.4